MIANVGDRAAQVVFRRWMRHERRGFVAGYFQNIRIADNVADPQRGQPGLFSEGWIAFDLLEGHVAVAK